MKIALSLAEGGRATLVMRSGEVVAVVSERPYPPGATFKMLGDGLEASVKVRGCRRTDEGFRIDGRFVSLSRDARIKLFGE